MKLSSMPDKFDYIVNLAMVIIFGGGIISLAIAVVWAVCRLVKAAWFSL